MPFSCFSSTVQSNVYAACHGLPDREEPLLLLLAKAGPFLISQVKMSTENTTAFPAAALK